mmetsp:Transcript_99447/g.280631  ORF Transcript_99447/g.280631 Transcript_99447/m.280631 type:complete len:230 (+) Transcript_99447:167-856(+)
MRRREDHCVGMPRLDLIVPTQVEALRIILLEVGHLWVILGHPVPFLEQTHSFRGVAHDEEPTVDKRLARPELGVVLLREEDELRRVKPVIQDGRGKGLRGPHVCISVDGDAVRTTFWPVFLEPVNDDLHFGPTNLAIGRMRPVVRLHVRDLVAMVLCVEPIDAISKRPEPGVQYRRDVAQRGLPPRVHHENASRDVVVGFREQGLALAAHWVWCATFGTPKLTAARGWR